MAKLSAHGTEIGRINYLTYACAYMSDSYKLINRGDGWKIKGKLKVGLTPQEAYDNAKHKLEVDLKSRPVYAAYRTELHAIAGLGKSAKLHTIITLMPDDYDGVWSECCDGYSDNVHADLAEIVNLCKLYACATVENKLQKE